MKSPFPGMDPYLERHWGDVHADLIALIRTTLNQSLPDDLIARMEERVVIDVDYSRQKAIYPDVRVYEDPSRAGAGPAVTSSAIAEPIILTFESEAVTETYVTILDGDGGELVTVIECLSPSNKLARQARDQYHRKREELLAARVNIVEIDLLRQGSRREFVHPLVIPGRVRAEYAVLIWRTDPRGRVELYPMSLRNRLPKIPIPLRSTDAPVELDLQAIVEQAYRNGRYDHTDYKQKCEPPFDAEDEAWARALIETATSG
jgi:hypothetical protein